MTAENDVADFQVGDGVFDYSVGIDVCGGDDVGDVAVDEDVTGLETQEGSFGDARVGAAEPDYEVVSDLCPEVYILRRYK